MLDFASLITSLTEQTKRRPYMQPEALPLPSEQATNEIAMGAGQAFGRLGSQLMGGGGGYNTVDTTSIDEMARTQPIIRGGHKGFGLGESALMGNADNTAEQYGDRAKGLISMGRGRRYGGPVNEGEPYVVGEEGMEIIVPKKDGEVIAASEVAAMSPDERATAQQSPTYERDAQGFAVRPEGVDPQARMRRSDGTESAWSWAGQDSVRNYSGKPAIGEQGRVADDSSAGKNTQSITEDDSDYYPNGIRKRPMDERDPSGNPIGGVASDIERSLANPNYNPAYDQTRMGQRTDGRPNLGSLIGNPLDADIAKAQSEYRAALDAPIKPHAKWKDAGAKVIQGLDAFFNGNRKPMVGYGRIKHDVAVDRANAKLNPLLSMKKNQQEIAFRDVQRQNVIDDNIQKQQELVLKQQIAANKKANAEAILADKKLGRELQATQIQDLKEYRQFLIATGTKMTDARIKQIEERLADYDLDREQRGQIADARDQTTRDKGMPKNNVPLPPRVEIKNDGDAKKTLSAINASNKPEAQKAAAREAFFKQFPHLRPK